MKFFIDLYLVDGRQSVAVERRWQFEGGFGWSGDGSGDGSGGRSGDGSSDGSGGSSGDGSGYGSSDGSGGGFEPNFFGCLLIASTARPF